MDCVVLLIRGGPQPAILNVCRSPSPCPMRAGVAEDTPSARDRAVDVVRLAAQVMPLFFLAGGAAGAYGWHTGTPWGTWRFTRAQRLCRPVFWYLVAWSTGLLVAHVILDRGPVMTLDHPAVASACCSLWD